MSTDPVLLDVSPEGVAVVTLNRPEKRNAFDELMITGLSDTFETLKGADHVRIVFIRGEGAVFCAGADIDWMRRAAQFTDQGNETDALALARMLRHLHELPQLTVALAHGAAMGGGAGLVAACDVAVAVKSTTFRFSEVRLGLTPATISPYVVEAVGPRWARALFATAESFDGTFAERIGLVQYAVEDDAALRAMMEPLSDLALAAAPGAVADAKALVGYVAGHKIDDSLAKETARRIAARRTSAEGREGLAAFLEKRKPEWYS
ncbi:MAG TPA: enoyl-CoA hydratase-related protein [Vitreimonas sp.]|uniref:enoyl-CoA hydratase-related protein n=1 Tax=Vitreimonas sp. TaxID=3069702 RepID=UPI002D65ABBA|nr:enoyl-CoA hydratase-related protein [Vitreimonas sp.]HYD87953.1 enoyl-CoA hydratase-related protein [Vitreimonas sp.]